MVARKSTKALENMNTTSSIAEERPVASNETQLKQAMQSAADVFAKEPKVKVMIPKSMKSRFGPTLEVGVNCVFVAIPVDGQQHEVNETHARHAMAMLGNAD